VNGSAFEHIPVLTTTLAEQINLPQDAVMVDATVGQGGHSFLFGQFFGPQGRVVGFDVDPRSLELAEKRLEGLACKVVLLQSNFSEISDRLCEEGIGEVDFILADLGVSSGQLTDEGVGLSFQQNMPLDMRLDKRLTVTAADIINRSDEKSLADLIYNYGEDRGSRRIARFIVRARESGPITSTGQLARIVSQALGGKGKGWSRIHPATRTFQALRIAVNDELENLKKLLSASPGLLKKGGKIAIISFHSLEDRIVKLDFKANDKAGLYRILTKKPLTASPDERGKNPRARSAKLRIAEKL
jgi:16S rRNA (cytosine1402-N4)-methyltransferase